MDKFRFSAITSHLMLAACVLTAAYGVHHQLILPFCPGNTIFAARLVAFSFWLFFLLILLVRLIRISLIELFNMPADDDRLERIPALFAPVLLWWVYPILKKDILLSRTLHGYLEHVVGAAIIFMFAAGLGIVFGRHMVRNSRRALRNLLHRKWIWRFSLPLFIILLALGSDWICVKAAGAYRIATNRNIILISIDTLRADHLGCYGAPYGITPAIDKLAGEGILFERVYSTAPWTAPAHMTMMTGLVPSEHGVNPSKMDEVVSLSNEIPTLAEMLQRNGYHTVGYAGSGFLSKAFGFGRGFDVFTSNLWEDTITRANEFIANQDSRQEFFLFVHTHEVHQYFTDVSGFRDFSPELARPKEAELREAYLKRVAVIDRKLGELILTLRRKGYDKNTLLILTSDHGEGFDEHNLFGHTNSLYDELLHVPLIITRPSLTASKRIAQYSSLADLLSTVLKWAGIEVPATLQRTYAIDLFDDSAIATREGLIFSENGLKDRFMYSIMTPEYKYINYPNAGKEFLFDLAVDPAETANLIERKPDVLVRYRSIAKEFRQELLHHVPVRGKLTEDLAGQLKALGYMQ